MVNSVDGVLGALNATAFSNFEAGDFASVALQVSGTFTGTITFETSVDGINWASKALVSGAGVIVSTTTAPGVWSGDIGGRYFRVRMSSYTSGTANLLAIFNRGSLSNNASSQVVSGSVSLTGSGTTSAVKAEDTANASGDLGIPAFGVRGSGTPATPTSAAGDYGYILLDDEGKQIISGTGHPLAAFQSTTALTTTSNVALRAAGAAGIRNYVTDLVFDNTAAAAARVIIQDGSTTIFSASIPANSSFNHSFKQPIRGTAATALNGQLGAAGTVTVTVSGYQGI